MSREMDRAVALRKIEDPHYNCAQAVVCAFAEKAGIPEDTAYRVSANFARGMKMGALCGAIAGGLMVLGLLGRDDAATVRSFLDEFRGRHDGLLDCKDLLRVNSEQGGDKKLHCDDMVFEAVEALESIL